MSNVKTLVDAEVLAAAVNAAELRGQDTGLALMQADNARLRALIKAAELGTESYCPWCNAKAIAVDHPADRMEHADTCPAFTPDGTVR